MNYFDTSYLARLYLEDPGWEKVRQFAATDHVGCSIHGKAECIAAFHRKFRDGAITQQELRVLLRQYEVDCDAGAFQWFPLSEKVIARLRDVYGGLPKNVLLRAADAIHLSSAAENGFGKIYSNDERLLAGAAQLRS